MDITPDPPNGKVYNQKRFMTGAPEGSNADAYGRDVEPLPPPMTTYITNLSQRFDSGGDTTWERPAKP